MAERWPVPIAALYTVTFFAVSQDVSAVQPTATVQGQVIDAETRAPLIGITVQLPPQAVILTDAEGRFAFFRVATGRYVLSVRGVGYAAEDLSLAVPGDTSIVIELAREPVPLDPIAAEARTITVRGVVKDGVSALRLIDVDVLADRDRAVVSDIAGRFKLNRVPAGVPVTIQARELGYLPMSVTIEADRDTTLEFMLEPDPVVAAMVSEAKSRLEVRSSERRYPGIPIIDRDELVRNVNRSVADVIRDVLRTRAGRITCIVIDENVVPLGRTMLETMLPDRFEHIEIIEYGPTRALLMVRLYTRDYFVALIARSAHLEPQRTLLTAARTGVCQ